MSEPKSRAFSTLSEDECRRLLETHDLGRIALVVDGSPQIFPVNYAYSDDVVVFRTSEGLKLDRSPLAPVAFEIDGLEPETSSAWSVMVQGTAQNITRTIDTRSERLRKLTVQPAAPGKRSDWIGIYVHRLSGRRFKVAIA
jgi:nitroimidazol reductase NimA-like FMN-containing flavoprotein (pyridoxamine 5'-phosphate oxidase superfamily)